jgi:hypothetical protein
VLLNGQMRRAGILCKLHRIVVTACHDLVDPAAVPGYSQCSPLQRWQLDWRALMLFCRDRYGQWVISLWIIALLAARIIAWHFDLGRPATDGLLLGSAAVLLLAVAVGRRRALRRLLGPHWQGL